MGARGAGGINEGLLPFKTDDDRLPDAAERLEERAAPDVRGHHARGAALMVSTLRRRKKGRDTVAGVPDQPLHRRDEAGRIAGSGNGSWQVVAPEVKGQRLWAHKSTNKGSHVTDRSTVEEQLKLTALSGAKHELKRVE